MASEAPGEGPHERVAAGCPFGSPRHPRSVSAVCLVQLFPSGSQLWSGATSDGVRRVGTAEQLARQGLERSGLEGWVWGWQSRQRFPGRGSRRECAKDSSRDLVSPGSVAYWLWEPLVGGCRERTLCQEGVRNRAGIMSPAAQVSIIALKRAAPFTGWKKPGWGTEWSPWL